MLSLIASTLNDESCSTVTCPPLKTTETSVTPSNAESALVTAFTQFIQLIPSTVSVVVIIAGGGGVAVVVTVVVV